MSKHSLLKLSEYWIDYKLDSQLHLKEIVISNIYTMREFPDCVALCNRNRKRIKRLCGQFKAIQSTVYTAHYTISRTFYVLNYKLSSVISKYLTQNRLYFLKAIMFDESCNIVVTNFSSHFYTVCIKHTDSTNAVHLLSKVDNAYLTQYKMYMHYV